MIYLLRTIDSWKWKYRKTSHCPELIWLCFNNDLVSVILSPSLSLCAFCSCSWRRISAFICWLCSFLYELNRLMDATAIPLRVILVDLVVHLFIDVSRCTEYHLHICSMKSQSSMTPGNRWNTFNKNQYTKNATHSTTFFLSIQCNQP